MAEPSETGSTEEAFRCPRCGEMFPTDNLQEADCPVCGTHCTRDKCLVLIASKEGY